MIFHDFIHFLHQMIGFGRWGRTTHRVGGGGGVHGTCIFCQREVVGGLLRPRDVECCVSTSNYHVVVEELERVVEKWSTQASRVNLFICDMCHAFFYNFMDLVGSNSSARCRSLIGTHIMISWQLARPI